MIIVNNHCLKGARTLSRGDVGVGEQNHNRGGGQVGLLGVQNCLDVGNIDDRCRGPSIKEKDHIVG